MMLRMFTPKPLLTPHPSNSTPLPESEAPTLRVLTRPTKHDAFAYLSDSDNDGWSSDDELEEDRGISLEVPYRVQREKDRAFQMEKLKSGLRDVDKLLKSAKTKFVGGVNGLQARHTRAIRAHIDLVVRNGCVSADAAECAAEANGFAAAWGGRQLRCHMKVATLLAIPSITTELCAYLRSNKWSMNPEKLAKFTNNEMITKEADLYLKNVINDEMPNALKRYIESELFPRIQLKMTAQSNDMNDKEWVFDNEFKLRKKGVGRGIHRSDVICSTCGHLSQAGESIEYGKNYEGYWNGERFCTQVHTKIFMAKKIIPAFEAAHGAGYQALFIIDNSQGHSAYAKDALRVGSRMNVNPGGKQARMQNGWFVHDGVRVEQEMVFAASHPQYPNQPKGIKFFWGRVKKYLRDNCDGSFETLKTNMPKALKSVQVNTVRLWEHRMHRWIEAYRSGLLMKEAQLQVRQFSSTKYKSHRRIPETVVRLFD
ncbi:hypothetical protein EDD22DRAFT_979392 [Suillus occidentalis]|nr:hypothetical protein EDD22DRAFT_979392 [Suillus occidentalis]